MSNELIGQTMRTLIKLLTICLLFIAGCSGSKPKTYFVADDYENRNILSIAILPLEEQKSLLRIGDITLDEKTKEEFEQIFKDVFVELGYNVIDVDEFLERMKTYRIEVNQLNDTTMGRLCSIIEVDAILKSRIIGYQSNYHLVSRVDQLSMELSLFVGDGSRVWYTNIDRKEENEGKTVLDIISAQSSSITGWIKEEFGRLPKAKR